MTEPDIKPLNWTPIPGETVGSDIQNAHHIRAGTPIERCFADVHTICVSGRASQASAWSISVNSAISTPPGATAWAAIARTA